MVGWLSGGLFFLFDAERHVTNTISIGSLTLEGTHSNYVSSGLEGLLALTTWSFWDISSESLLATMCTFTETIKSFFIWRVWWMKILKKRKRIFTTITTKRRTLILLEGGGQTLLACQIFCAEMVLNCHIGKQGYFFHFAH